MDKLIPDHLPIRLTRKQAAEFLGVSVPTLARWASRGFGPQYFVLGGKARYEVEALTAFIEAAKQIR